jgi:hypothetical protein
VPSKAAFFNTASEGRFTMADDRDRKVEEELKRELQKFMDAGGTYEEALAMLQREFRANDNGRSGPEKK